MDATYFGRNTGILVALESGSGRLLYMAHIAHEHISDYEAAVSHILSLALADKDEAEETETGTEEEKG